MSQILIVSHFTTLTTVARDKFIEAAQKVAAYAKANEPGVTKFLISQPRGEKEEKTTIVVEKFVVVIPQDEKDERTVFTFEEYADQTSLDAHRATKPVQDFLALLANEQILDGEPMMYNLDPACAFTRPQITEAKIPFITFDSVVFKHGTRDEMLSYGEKVCAMSQKDEPGTLFYALCKDPTKPDNIHGIEVYESEEYLWDIHCSKEVCKTALEAMNPNIASNSHAFVKVVGGYWYK